MFRLAFTSFLLLAPALTRAQDCSIAVVDFERAVLESAEGQSAQAKFDRLYAKRKAVIERLRADLQADVLEGRSKRSIREKQARLDEATQRSEVEVKAAYQDLLEELDGQMRAMVSHISTERGCAIVFDKATVVHASDGVTDLTDSLIERLDEE